MRRLKYLYLIVCLSLSQFVVGNNQTELKNTVKLSNMNNCEYYFNKGIKNLDDALELCETIKDDELKYSVTTELKTCKECFEKEFSQKNFSRISHKAEILYENLPEVIAECSSKIRLEIPRHIGLMIVNFDAAESASHL